MSEMGVTSLSGESFEIIKQDVERLLRQNLYNEHNPMGGNALIAYKNHVVRVAKALTDSAKGVEFLATQGVLKMMNPGPIGTGKILSPLVPFGAPPGGEGYLTDAADIPFSAMNPLPDRSVREDKLKHLAKEKHEDYKARNLNLYDDENTSTENFYIDNDQPESLGVAGMMTVEPVPGVQYSVPDYSRVFEEKGVGIDFGTGEKGAKSFKPVRAMRGQASELMRRRRKMLDNSDAFFTQGELETGYITSEELSLDGVEEASNYMPFFLEDMRSGGKRVYFRAFFKGLRESISPNWTTETYYGRVDPVGVYLGTSRSVSVSFAVVAMSPAGFTAMWRKLNALAKMLYPTYKDGIMVKSPVCRIRVGDVICDAEGRGLTGYISSPLELDYTDMPWEITNWLGFDPKREMGKAPQMATVSFTFQVIHERNPSVDEDYNFDTSYFRRIGGLQENGAPLDDEGGEMTFTEEETQ